MKSFDHYGKACVRSISHGHLPVLMIIVSMAELCPMGISAQEKTPSISAQIQELTTAVEREQELLRDSQRQVEEMRRQLVDLQQQIAIQEGRQAPVHHSQTEAESSSSSAALEAIRERQALQEEQIATHDQIKVESESKYPVKVTGLLLLNGFVNTNAVNMPATPTLAVQGSGSTGASVSQTVLGIDARGPHLFEATSYADIRVDFFGNATAIPALGPYYTNNSLLRLRTAHAGLHWQNTEAAFSLDRPILSPDAPSSLTAVANPPLAWSGNLWAWNPQLTFTRSVRVAESSAVQLQAALIDPADPPVSLSGLYSGTAVTPASSAEQSRWPGLEARVAVLGSMQERRDHIGVGGYFSPHELPSGHRYDAWAASLDAGVHLPARLEFSGDVYRGLALGGLGAGCYKDYGYFFSSAQNEYYFRPLNDVGGWVQLKEKWSERLELNAAFGIDNAFASDLHRYANPGGSVYQRLARNRTWTGNVIYSPSAYLLFSLEYRYLASAPITGPSIGANVIGVSAGYKF